MSLKIEKIELKEEDIFVPNQTIQKVQNFLLQNNEVLVAITNETIQNFTPIQKHCYDFLANVQRQFLLLQQAAIEQQIIQKSKQLIQQGKEGSALSLAKTLTQNEKTLNAIDNFLTTIAIQIDSISIQLKKILGQQSSMIYIPDYGNPILYQTKLENLISGGQYSAIRLTKNAEDMESLVKSNRAKKINIRRHLGIQQATILQSVYKEIYQRYQDHLNSTHRVMWNMGSSVNNPNWNVMKVLNKGDLVQTYSNIVFSRKYTFNNAYVQGMLPQRSIQIFMIAMHDVDSVSGFLSDDIQSLSGKKGYAIKGYDASTQKVSEALKLILDLITITDSKKIKQTIKERQKELKYTKEGQIKGIRNWIQGSVKKSFI